MLLVAAAWRDSPSLPSGTAFRVETQSRLTGKSHQTLKPAPGTLSSTLPRLQSGCAQSGPDDHTLSEHNETQSGQISIHLSNAISAQHSSDHPYPYIQGSSPSCKLDSNLTVFYVQSQWSTCQLVESNSYILFWLVHRQYGRIEDKFPQSPAHFSFKAFSTGNVENMNASKSVIVVEINMSDLFREYRTFCSDCMGPPSLLGLCNRSWKPWEDVAQKMTALAIHLWGVEPCPRCLLFLTQRWSNSLQL